MKKYDNYKDSGIEWVGKIPEYWETIKFNLCISIRHGHQFMNYDFKEDGVKIVKITQLHKNGFLDLTSCSFVSKERVQEFENILIKERDILMCLTGGTIGKIIRVGKVNEPLLQNYRVGHFSSAIKNKISDDFIFWVMSSEYLVSQIFFQMRETGQPNIGMDDFGRMKITLPPIDEQTQIANFLDHKTTQIDTLISKKQQFINLLQEERIAVINQAVTKGLDPKVKMKDSGIEWLGEIPEHWEIYRIDWITNIVRGNTGFKKDELLDSGEYVALQYGKTYKVDVVDDSFNYFVNSEFFKENQIVSKGDTILISTSETIEDLGHVCYYDNENVGLLGGEQILLKPNRKVLYEKYLYQYTRQLGLELKKYAKGLKVFRFNTSDLKQIFIAIPSIEEQIQIADFLDREIIRIESLTIKMKKEIELLKEYKTALISEVVTGKVDVREEVLN